MRLVAWHVGRRNILFAPLIAITAFGLTHICCLLPMLALPLGLGSAYSFFNGGYSYWELGVGLLAIAILLVKGWQLQKRKSGKLEKVLFGISVLLVVYMVLLK